METLSEGAREVIREKISEEVRRQYLEVTWAWFEEEALPDYLQHREKSLWDRYEKRLKDMPATAPPSSRDDLRSRHSSSRYARRNITSRDASCGPP